MFFPVSESERRQAKSPHELAMVNLLLFNLLALIALLGGSFLETDSPLAPYRALGVAVPLVLAIGVVAYSFRRAGRAGEGRSGRDSWFVAAHWRLAADRYRILLGSYVGGAVLIGFSWKLAHSQANPAMQDLMFIALQRVAIAPLLIALMVLVMLESGSIYQASRGEVPDGIVKRLPPPPGLEGSAREIAAA